LFTGEGLLKIRIFALAKELGMDSKVLIDECNKAGVKLKNSALASITPEERDIVIDYLQKQDQPAEGASDQTEQAAMAPQREPQKMRTIKAMTSRPQPSRSSQKARTEEEKPELEEEVSSADVEQTEDATEAAVAEQTASETDLPSQEVSEPAATEEQAEETPKPKDETKPETDQGMSREDYVPAGGAPTSSIREMKPIGSPRSSKPQSKSKKNTALPSVAAPPAYKQPVIPK
jgi:translation initiation factor IF-2